MANRSERLRLAGIVLAYVLTIAGILGLPWLFALSRSWVIGFVLFVFVVPLFPAVQTLLLGERPFSLAMFGKIYVAEYASLVGQLLFLLVTVPFIVVAVAGRLVLVLLVTAVLAWFLVGLQQLGLTIGSGLSRQDITILFWVTLGLAASSGIYYGLVKLAQKYEDDYFEIWARQFRRIREFLRY